MVSHKSKRFLLPAVYCQLGRELDTADTNAFNTMTVTHHEIRESEGQRKAWSVSPLAEESVDESSVDDHKYHQPTQRNKPYLNASYPPPSNPSYHMTYPPMATPSPYAYYAASFHHARRHASLYQSNGRHRQPISYFRPSCLFPPKASTPMSDAKRVQPTQGSFCTCKKSRYVACIVSSSSFVILWDTHRCTSVVSSCTANASQLLRCVV